MSTPSTPSKPRTIDPEIAKLLERLNTDMINPNDPAFPNSFVDKTNPAVNHTIVVDGLSIRAWLAGQALSNPNICSAADTQAENAIEAVAVADAVIAELNKQSATPSTSGEAGR